MRFLPLFDFYITNLFSYIVKTFQPFLWIKVMYYMILHITSFFHMLLLEC